MLPCPAKLHMHKYTCLPLWVQTSGDALEGGLYRCNLSQEMADAIARNIKLSLQHYLKLG